MAVRPEIRAFLSLRMFVLYCDFAEENIDFYSLLEEVLLGKGQGNHLSRNRKVKIVYQSLPTLFDKTNLLSLNVTSEGKSIVIVVSPLYK